MFILGIWILGICILYLADDEIHPIVGLILLTWPLIGLVLLLLFGLGYAIHGTFTSPPEINPDAGKVIGFGIAFIIIRLLALRKNKRDGEQ